jgi:hypothetical protein
MASQSKSSTGNQKISIYVTFIVLIVIVLSVVALVLAAYTYTNTSDPLAAGLLGVIGLVALFMSIFTFYQSRRQITDMKIEIPKVMTTIGCSNKNCSEKTVREFARGDFVYKILDSSCQKCSGKQMITAIYKEVKEKEKTYNV